VVEGRKEGRKEGRREGGKDELWMGNSGASLINQGRPVRIENHAAQGGKGNFERKKNKKQEMRKEVLVLFESWLAGHYSLPPPYHYLHSDGDLTAHLR